MASTIKAIWLKICGDGSVIKMEPVILNPLLPYPKYRHERRYVVTHQRTISSANKIVCIIGESGRIEWRTNSDQIRDSMHAILPELMNFISVDVIQNC